MEKETELCQRRSEDGEGDQVVPETKRSGPHLSKQMSFIFLQVISHVSFVASYQVRLPCNMNDRLRHAVHVYSSNRDAFLVWHNSWDGTNMTKNLMHCDDYS